MLIYSTCLLMLFYRMNLMGFAYHLNSLLLIFCFFSVILSLLFHLVFVPIVSIYSYLKLLLYLKGDSNRKAASLYSILTYQIRLKNTFCTFSFHITCWNFISILINFPFGICCWIFNFEILFQVTVIKILWPIKTGKLFALPCIVYWTTIVNVIIFCCW